MELSPPQHPAPAQYAGRGRRLPARRSAWAVAIGGTAAERLAVALDPQATAEDLAAVAPGWQDPDPDPALVAAVLDHPAVPAGVVARFVRCPDPALRVRVAQHSQCTGTALDVLVLDPVPEVRAAAIARRAAEADGRVGPPRNDGQHVRDGEDARA